MALSLQELGSQVQAARSDKGWSQEEFAGRLSSKINRSQVAHLEQGRRLPSDVAVLQEICQALGIPRRYWGPFVEPDYRSRLEFEEALSELLGRVVTLRFLDEQSEQVAGEQVASFFQKTRNEAQALDAVNSLLVFYGATPMASDFFRRYFQVDATKSTAAFMRGVRKFQTEAIRLFSTFEEAYRVMNGPGGLDHHLRPLLARDPRPYHNREPWPDIEEVPEARLPDLGYISAKEATKEKTQRELLADFLRDLASKVETQGRVAVDSYTEKKRRKMGSLLRAFESRLEHDFMSPLFSPDPDGLRREAEAVAPKGESDLERIGRTQAQAQRNLARYLAADHLDVYVATSMRVDADFVSVNRFTQALFSHSDVKPLNLRYFNPTQSWIDDRVAKGLVEALMLRRSSLTMYMAQKSDTFGKDSEASVALGQGKAVIVFVPKLHFQDIDSEAIWSMSRADLERDIAKEGGEDDKEADPTMDQDALVSRLISLRLQRLDASAFAPLVRTHWADFDLYGEDQRVEDLPERAGYRKWLDDTVRGEKDVPLEGALRARVTGILVAVAVRFEGRAKLFRDTHPLALQLILSTGVLNGMLVARSVDTCAKLIESLIKNELAFELRPEADNYRLVEVTTQSTARVISRHALITNAFSAFHGSGTAAG
jgi:transcriptional regulator with XRE-family HTH domain